MLQMLPSGPFKAYGLGVGVGEAPGAGVGIGVGVAPGAGVGVGNGVNVPGVPEKVWHTLQLYAA